jgi:RNA polymerase-binding protein DksA
MKQQDLEKFRERLLRMGDDLEGKVRGLKDEALRSTADEVRSNLSKTPMHLADLSSEHYNQQIATDLLQNERDMLAEVVAALQRLEDGTYGKCESCGKGITRERLDAVPYTRHCIQCAQTNEIAEQ